MGRKESCLADRKGRQGIGGPLRLAAVAWAAVGLSGCAPTGIDAERPTFVSPPAITAREATRAELSLIHGQTQRELNVEAGAAERPAASQGALMGAYERWATGEVKELPEPSESASGASEE